MGRGMNWVLKANKGTVGLFSYLPPS